MKTYLLTGGDTSAGENSKDLASSIPQGEASLLQNLLPGLGTPRPRAGCGPFTVDPLNSIIEPAGVPGVYTGSRLIAYEFYQEKIVFVFKPGDRVIVIPEDGVRQDITSAEIGIGSAGTNFTTLESHFIADGLIFYVSGGKMWRLEKEGSTWKVFEAAPHTQTFKSLFPYWFVAPVRCTEASNLATPIASYKAVVWNSEIAQYDGAGSQLLDAGVFMYANYLLTFVRRLDILPTAESSVYSEVIFETRHTREDTRLCQKLKFPLAVTDAGANMRANIGGTWTDVSLGSSATGVYCDFQQLKKDNNLIPLRDIPAGSKANVAITMPNDIATSVTGTPYYWGEADLNGTAQPAPGTDYFPGATHIRVYRTLFAPSKQEAIGSPLRFVADIPIGKFQDCTHWLDTSSDEELMGSLYTYDLLDAVDLPVEKAIHFFQGKAWSISNGRVYGSVPPSDPTSVSRWLPYSRTSTDWFTTAVGNSDQPIAISDDRENVIAFGTDSVWVLMKGDLGLGAIKITDNVGIRGPRCFAKTDEGLVFLSYSGPMVVSGLRVGEFPWKVNTLHRPKTRQHALDEWSSGGFFGGTEVILADNFQGKVAGFYYGATTGGKGGFSIEYGNGLTFLDYCTFSDQTLVGISEGPDNGQVNLNKVLHPQFQLDNGHPFNCKYISKAYKYEPSEWERFPKDDRSYLELFDMSLDSKILATPGTSEFTLSVYVDDRYTVSSNLYFIPAYDDQRQIFWQSDLQFGFKEGVCGRFIRFGWESSTPEDFVVYGWSARVLKRDNPPPRFTTSNQEVMTILSPVPELVAGYQITENSGPEIV